MIIRKLFKAEMAHATLGAYTERCRHLHGHSYRFELFLKSRYANPAQMVSDFKAVKDSGINDFFDSFDHATCVWDKDPRAKVIKRINPERHLLVPFNPTAEMLAKACFEVCSAIIKNSPRLSGEKDVSVHKVIVHETDTGYAVYRDEDALNNEFPAINVKRLVFSAGIKAEWKNKRWYKAL